MSARVKWGQHPSLVLLLPHAHEGQGPDHASARPERFLQLAADINMRIANCTTAAQYFHLLRRQAALLLTDPLPLIVLSPKSLLRHAMVASTPRELAEGRFRVVLDDDERAARAGDVRRVIVCTGKVYVDLVARRAARGGRDIAIVRVEQLYPVPARAARGARRLTARPTTSSGSRKSRRTWARGTSSARTSRRRPAGAPCARSRARAARARPKGPPRATRGSSSMLIDAERFAASAGRSAQPVADDASPSAAMNVVRWHGNPCEPSVSVRSPYARKYGRPRSRRVDRRRARREVAEEGRGRRRRRRRPRRARDRQDRPRGRAPRRGAC